LTFSEIFNKKLKKNVLPPSLTHLTIQSVFNKKIIIPSSVRELKFNSSSIIKHNIPEFIETVHILFDDYETITNLPITIKEIKIDNEEDIHLIKKMPFGCVVTIVK
jgi:hypothetical protein